MRFEYPFREETREIYEEDESVRAMVAGSSIPFLFLSLWGPRTERRGCVLILMFLWPYLGGMQERKGGHEKNNDVDDIIEDVTRGEQGLPT